MADRVLVTGISGFIGGHVALQLIEAGYIVRGSVRDLGRADRVRSTLARHGADPARLEFVALDLMEDAGWAEAMNGVRYLQHVASPFLIRLPKDRDELIRPAVQGTRRALEAAFAAEVERVVLTSSLAAVMYGHPRERTRPYAASDWTNLEAGGIGAYIESKTRAEREAWRLADAAGRRDDLVAINPGMVLGPLLDEDPGTSATVVSRLLDGSVPAAPRVPMVVVDVRDVAALHVAAMIAPDAGGRRFPVGNGTYYLMDIARMLRKAVPERAGRLPRFTAPDFAVRLFALFDRDLRDNVDGLGSPRHIDAGEAMELLGRPFIAAEEAVAATARSLIEQHVV